jgi:hypothetical protein
MPLRAAGPAPLLRASITKQIIAPCSSPPAKLIKPIEVNPLAFSVCGIRWSSTVPEFIDPVFAKTSPKLVYKFGHSRRAWIHLQAELQGTHKRMRFASCKNDVIAHPLCMLILFGPQGYLARTGFFLKLTVLCWNFKQSIVVRDRVGIGLSYRPARLHRLAKLIPWNRFLGSLKVKKFGLRVWIPHGVTKSGH